MSAHSEAPTSPGREGYRWVYMWHWPIRAMHWLAAGSLVVLVATGFYIGRPYFAPAPGETADLFVMGTMRFVHFVAAGVLVATGIVRVYWLFAGNRYERLPALFPLRGRDIRNLFLTVRKYALMQGDAPPHYVGHNPLQQLSYTGFYLIILAQVLTGFALYGLADPDGFFYRVLGFESAWFLGGVPMVRFIHHVLTWVILIFVPIHVYLALRADLTEHTGTISSIVSGGRYVRSDVDYEDI
jgi:Ni/Fe-hydrogenase b-type cytochrome subunit